MSPQQVTRIIELRREGRSYQHIGNSMGLSRETIRKVLNQDAPELVGWKSTVRKGSPDYRDRDVSSAVLKLRKSGKTYKEIREIAGVPYSHARVIVEKSGVVPDEKHRDRDTAMVEMKRNGMTHRQIADKMGVSMLAVTLALKREAPEMVRRRITRDAMTKRDRAVKQMHEQGATLRDIAETFNLKIANISRIIRK